MSGSDSTSLLGKRGESEPSSDSRRARVARRSRSTALHLDEFDYVGSPRSIFAPALRQQDLALSEPVQPTEEATPTPQRTYQKKRKKSTRSAVSASSERKSDRKKKFHRKQQVGGTSRSSKGLRETAPPPEPQAVQKHVKSQDYGQHASQNLSNEFWKFVNDHFAKLSEDQLSILEEPAPSRMSEESRPIPPHGKHYAEQWNEEDERFDTEIRTKLQQANILAGGDDNNVDRENSVLSSYVSDSDENEIVTARRRDELDRVERDREVVAHASERLDRIRRGVEVEVCGPMLGIHSLHQRIMGLFVGVARKGDEIECESEADDRRMSRQSGEVQDDIVLEVPAWANEDDLPEDLVTLLDSMHCCCGGGGDEDRFLPHTSGERTCVLDYMPNVMNEVEGKIMNELHQLQVLKEDDKFDVFSRYDDELALEIRKKQEHLRAVVERNRVKRRQLYERAVSYLETMDNTAEMDAYYKKLERTYTHLRNKKGGKKQRGKTSRSCVHVESVLQRYEEILQSRAEAEKSGVEVPTPGSKAPRLPPIPNMVACRSLSTLSLDQLEKKDVSMLDVTSMRVDPSVSTPCVPTDVDDVEPDDVDEALDKLELFFRSSESALSNSTARNLKYKELSKMMSDVLSMEDMLCRKEGVSEEKSAKFHRRLGSLLESLFRCLGKPGVLKLKEYVQVDVAHLLDVWCDQLLD